MIIYSNKIVQFIHEIKFALQNILSLEARLKVAGNRFYNQEQTASYPIKIVIYNNKSALGYFDPNFYELGFHECLMFSNRNQLLDIVRHELAHYMTFIKYGATIQPHATEFRAVCQSMGWGEEVYKATICLEGRAEISANIEENGILKKVQKLMALSTSSNKHEAEQAMIKSQQLLLKHNIDSKYIGGSDEEKVFLKRIMKQKRDDAKMRSIARILATFFVSVIYNRGEDFICIEVLGSAVNIEIAEYVAIILNDQFEKLWIQAQQQAGLKGLVAKNSFFHGLAKGYCNKIQDLKREYASDVMRELMIIEKKLVDAQAMVYQRLTTSKSNASHCAKSSALGEIMGKQLSINPAINRSPTDSKKLISY